jgi:hypothetical protein
MRTHLLPRAVVRRDPENGNPVWADWAPPASFTELRSQNERLKKECLRLMAELATHEQLKKQVAELRSTIYKQSTELANLRRKLK